MERARGDRVYLMTGFAPEHRAAAAGRRADRSGRPGFREHDPETLETTVPGVFIAGVVVAGFDANKVFIENGRYHGDRIVARLLGKPAPADAATERASWIPE